jgi:hypothetical protein
MSTSVCDKANPAFVLYSTDTIIDVRSLSESRGGVRVAFGQPFIEIGQEILDRVFSGFKQQFRNLFLAIFQKVCHFFIVLKTPKLFLDIFIGETVFDDSPDGCGKGHFSFFLFGGLWTRLELVPSLNLGLRCRGW